MAEWKDITSYSKRDKERLPRMFELEIRGLRIVIHRIIHCEAWFLTCYKLDIKDRQLNADSLEKAKKEGLELIIMNIEVLWEIRKNLIDEFVQ